MRTVILCAAVCLFLPAAFASAQPAGTRIDFAPPDGEWDATYDGAAWNPPITRMPPVGTVVDADGDGVVDAVLIDRNGNGVADAVADVETGAVLMELEEPAGAGEVGPRAGTRIDFAPPDGEWDATYDGAAWNPPITRMPPVGTVVDADGDGVVDAVLIDRNGNGVADAVADAETGAVLMELEEPAGAGGPPDGAPPVGTRLDLGPNPDGEWDTTWDGARWNPPLQGMPPAGTLADLDGDGVPDAVLVDQDGDGVADGVDVGMDGSVDQQL
ncbi:MAG: hypothetical protein PHN82_00930 [bacterium]|nr:hypothetical protein [bacterium]